MSAMITTFSHDAHMFCFLEEIAKEHKLKFPSEVVQFVIAHYAKHQGTAVSKKCYLAWQLEREAKEMKKNGSKK